MNILLIEDNKLKKEQIIKLIDKEFLCLLSIDVAYNLEEAKNKIMNSKYDIYILDLSIKSGLHEASIDYGFEIYDTIKNLTKNIIIYSTVDNLIKHPRNNEFNENLVPFIDYTSKEKDWEYKLIEFLRNFVKFDELNYDIAILTALDDEFHWMKKASETSWYSFEKNDNTFYVSKISNDFGEEVSIVAYSINKMGIAYSSSIATKILIDFKPKLLVMTGICAGLEKVADKGDIIVPEYIFNYQEGDITEDGFVPAFKVKQLNSKISKLVKQTKDSYTIDIKNDWEKKYNSFGKMPGGTFKIINEKHFGTGSAVVKDETILNDIR